MSSFEQLQDFVGREQSTWDGLAPFPARALAAMLDHTQLPQSGDALPPLWHWLYFLDPAAAGATGDDGHRRTGEFLPPAPLPRRMWAAGAVEIARPLRLGRTAERISRIASIDVKRGKSGQLVFVNVQHELRQDDMFCLRELQTLVYRERSPGPEPLGPGQAAATEADWSRSFEPSAVQLFRFSALAYNGHRIHYDRAYATGVEHYPGLVVQAPLLVVLLLDLLPPELAASVRDLRFRALRPSFDLGTLSLRGKREHGEIALWSADHENYIGMQAQATLADARGLP